MHLKHIPMDGPQNFRDLGGFQNKDGKITAWNRLYRADSLARLSQEDQKKMQERNIRTIVDLRSISEQKENPDPVMEGVTYISCPMMKEEMGNVDTGEHSFMKSMVTGYQLMVEEGADLIGNAVNAVLGGMQNGAVVFHCTAGKDRTGILAAVLLRTLNAYEEDIIADYQVSHTYFMKGFDSLPEFDPMMKEYLEMAGEESMLHSHPKNIKAVLKIIKAESIKEWLVKHNVEAGLIDYFRNEMLTAGC